jgi:hypothetical protein
MEHAASKPADALTIHAVRTNEIAMAIPPSKGGTGRSHDDEARPDRPVRPGSSIVDVEQPSTADDDSESQTYGVSINMSTWIAELFRSR